MIETKVQTLVIEAVRAHGGEARKLSNRFNIGVCDLLIKLGGGQELTERGGVQDFYPAMLMEVKLDKRVIGFAARMNAPVAPAVTVPQHSFLTAFARAGMLCGVMSFVEEAHRGKRGLWLQIVRVGPGHDYRPGWSLRPDHYTKLEPLNLFDQVMVDMLKEFA